MAVTLALFFRVCLLADPNSCRELPPLPLAENTSLMGCLLASQMEGAKWVAAHPNHFVAKARCAPAQSRLADI